jgi:hypothetical protein
VKAGIPARSIFPALAASTTTHQVETLRGRIIVDGNHIKIFISRVARELEVHYDGRIGALQS